MKDILENFKKLIKTGIEFNSKIPLYFLGNLIFSMILAVSTLFVPKLLVNEILADANPNNIIFISIGYILIAGISSFIVSYIKRDYVVILKFMQASQRRKLQLKSLERPLSDLEDEEKREASYYAFRTVQNFTTGFEGMYNRLFSMSGNLFTLLMYVVVMLNLNISIGIILLILMGVSFAFSRVINDRVLQIDRGMVSRFIRMEYLSNTLTQHQYGKDIRSFGIAEWLMYKYNLVFDSIRGDNAKIQREVEKLNILDVFITLIRNGLAYSFLVWSILHNRIEIGDFTVYFTAITMFGAVVKIFFEDISFLLKQLKPLSHYFSLLEVADEIVLSGKGAAPKADAYEIEFKNLYFKYPKSETNTLSNISFKINAGEKMAIVGVNGAGKTTLTKLLTRLYSPDSGEIYIDGVDVNSIDLKEYRDLFAVVPQKNIILATSLGENIAYSKDYDAERAISAIEKAGFNEKFMKLERGLDTQLEKNVFADGVELSGGEKQKLALARALYRDSKIMILDEPTAALDAIAEYELYENFSRMTEGKTTIFISHRLASTRFCDRIVLMSANGIEEIGTHDELMKSGGEYYQMYNTQMSYYKEGNVCEI